MKCNPRVTRGVDAGEVERGYDVALLGRSTPRDEFFFPRRDGEGEMIGVRLYHVCLGDFDFGKKHSVPMLLTLGPKFLAIPKQRR